MKDGKKNLEVVPVDNGLSDWRTLWVPDTVEMDGVKWLRKNDGGKGHVLLLVYPQVSYDFTAKTIQAYSMLIHGTWIDHMDLLTLSHRRLYDCDSRLAERQRLHRLRQRAPCRLVRSHDARLGEGLPGTFA